MLLIAFVLISAFFSRDIFSNQTKKFYLPDKSGFIFGQCDNNLCDIFLKKKTTDTYLVLKNSPYPSIKSLNKNLIELFFSCGSPCNYTIFYSSSKGISKSFEFVVAVDIKKDVVVIAEENELVGYKIFNNTKTPLFRIKRNWAPTATLFTAILKAKFIHNSLRIKYLEGKNFDTKVEVIHKINDHYSLRR